MFLTVDPAIEFAVLSIRRVRLDSPFDARPCLQLGHLIGFRLEPIAPVVSFSIGFHLPPVGIEDHRAGRVPITRADWFEGRPEELFAVGGFSSPFELSLARIGHEPAAAVPMVAIILAVPNVMPHIQFVVTGPEPLHERHILVTIFAQLDFGRAVSSSDGRILLRPHRIHILGRFAPFSATDFIP